MIEYIILGILGLMVGVCKGVSDRVSTNDEWWGSILSSTSRINEFWGSKEESWKNKDVPSKFWNYLYHTALVWVTDAWHFFNMLRVVAYMGMMIVVALMDDPIWWIVVVVFYVSRQVAFNLLYHRILKK